jgi:hypothetical protein
MIRSAWLSSHLFRSNKAWLLLNLLMLAESHLTRRLHGAPNRGAAGASGVELGYWQAKTW